MDFKGIDETNGTHLRFETRHTVSSMSHKPNPRLWDQDVAASPREFHETDNNHTNCVDLLATWQYFPFRHQVFETCILPKIIEKQARQKKFPDLRKIIIFCKNNEQRNCLPF